MNKATKYQIKDLYKGREVTVELPDGTRHVSKIRMIDKSNEFFVTETSARNGCNMFHLKYVVKLGEWEEPFQRRLTEEQYISLKHKVRMEYSFQNRHSYYTIVENKTRRTSTERGGGNVGYGLDCLIERQTLKLLGVNHNEFLDWQTIGVEESRGNKTYLFQLNRRIVKEECGFDITKQIVGLEIK